MSNTAVFTKFVSTVAVIIASIVVMLIIRSSLRKLAKGKVKEHFRKAVYRIFQIIVWTVALFVVFGIWGVNITGLLAGAGFMGIVVGLAAQETLGNVVSGLVMMFSRPFEIGDWVEIADNSGIVQEITVINTRIETFDGEIVSIPNNMVSSNKVNNKSRMERLRGRAEIGIDYESDPMKAREIAEEEMENHKYILEDPSPRAMIDELSDSSVKIVLLFWIGKPLPRRRRKVKNDIIASVKKRFKENDIGIPFPHTELIQHEGREWKFSRKEE